MYTTEEMLERWEAVHEIENMMGRRAAMLLTVRDDEVFETMWSKNEPCLGFNDGYYKGYDAVAGYFRALHAYQLLRAEAAKRLYPDELGDKTAEQLFGVGSFHGNNLTTPVIELAENMKTAKGIWYLFDGEVDYGPEGYKAYNCQGRIGVDFIFEDGAWKIWHLVYAEDLRCPMGDSWAEETRSTETAIPELAAFEMPKPNVPMTVHESWYSRRQFKAFPAVPVPYDSFENTFSYGV